MPALAAGNALVLRHSSQSPLCAERFAEAFTGCDLPDGLFHYVHCSQDDTLATLGYEVLTRPQSFHLRHPE